MDLGHLLLMTLRHDFLFQFGTVNRAEKRWGSIIILPSNTLISSIRMYAFITLVPAWAQAEAVGFCCQPFLTEEHPGPTREQMSWSQAQLGWEEALLLLPWLSGD